MSTTQIPPATPAAPPPSGPRLDGSDLYDSGRWESAYTELHDAPSLLVQLQDDLTRSRKRESLWLSVIVHLVIVILLVNAKRFEKWFPERKMLVVSPNDWMRSREVTYLDLPPDAQKITKRPDTNRISDKNRIATSKTPQLDTKELKKLLDSSRPGAPTPDKPAPAPQPPPEMAKAEPPAAQPEPQLPKPQNEPQQPALANPAARAQTQPAPKPTFNTGPLSAGSAIAQAARAAAASRGGGYGGDVGGDYGLGQGRSGARAQGNLDVLSDTMGVDFGPYLARVVRDVKANWYNLIPEAARPPLMKKGKVAIEFAILKDGRVAGLQLTGSSGDVSLDRAAWGGITGSNPFPPLPSEFGGQYLALRFSFYYNLNTDGSEVR
jgi:TonB family protein